MLSRTPAILVKLKSSNSLNLMAKYMVMSFAWLSIMELAERKPSHSESVTKLKIESTYRVHEFS